MGNLPRRQDTEINLADLEPGETNPHDQPNQYNPLNYCYKIIIEELNMELVVKFIIENLDHDEKHPIEFTTKEGKDHTIPFFPRLQKGNDPAKDHTPGDTTPAFYKECDHPYFIIPTVVRGTVLGDGLDKGPVLVSREFVRDNVSPDRLADALEEFRDIIKEDMNAPQGLLDLLDNALGHTESWNDGYEIGNDEEGEW